MPQAVRATEALLGEFAHQLDAVTLQPSRGGVFEVTVDEDLVYSKKETKRHATIDELCDALRQRLVD
ncbi:MAG: Rdx family protein [Anaerolineae bacterium]|nr:Rdx family protein [Anaerolineae bacterium]